MNASIKALAGDSITLAINAACDSIAPTWPLDRMIAVNPYWQRIGQSFENTAGALAQIAGSPMTMPLSYYRAHWQAGSILPGHLQQAIAEANSGIDAADAIAGLQQESKTLTPAPLLCDTLDARRDLIHEPAWCDTITHQIGQFCAAWFDRDQADWRVNQQQDLYTGWRKSMSCDHSVALLMKAPRIPAKARSLAEAPGDQIEQALAQLGIAAGQRQAYLQAVMMRVSGWAACCAYRRWQARLAGNDDNTLV
ncbi:MAG TPA: putative inorganic carbon transporter subunit DabA, partial [Pseudomonadales bacterium]